MKRDRPGSPRCTNRYMGRRIGGRLVRSPNEETMDILALIPNNR